MREGPEWTALTKTSRSCSLANEVQISYHSLEYLVNLKEYFVFLIERVAHFFFDSWSCKNILFCKVSSITDSAITSDLGLKIARLLILRSLCITGSRFLCFWLSSFFLLFLVLCDVVWVFQRRKLSVSA